VQEILDAAHLKPAYKAPSALSRTKRFAKSCALAGTPLARSLAVVGWPTSRCRTVNSAKRFLEFSGFRGFFPFLYLKYCSDTP
jgi:hypothetical protein